MDGFRDKLIQPRATGCIFDPPVLNRLVGQENAGCERLRPEEGEKRPELVLDDKRVAIASPGGQ